MQNDLMSPSTPASDPVLDAPTPPKPTTFNSFEHIGTASHAPESVTSEPPGHDSPSPNPIWSNNDRADKTPDTPTLSAPSDDRPVPVVKVLSVRGVEYLFMSIMLWISAGAFVGLVLSLLNGGTGFSVLAFPLALLMVCLPGFAYLFLRLKRAELANPDLRFDASKRRLTQITQVLAFLTCLINIITFVYLILQQIGGEGELELGKAVVNMFVILAVAGGILAYYWHDEHRIRR